MRPGMYIGSTSKEGLTTSMEIVDNSIDEALAGFASLFKSLLKKTILSTVVDDGRGIPVDIQENGRLRSKPSLLFCSWRKFGGGG